MLHSEKTKLVAFMVALAAVIAVACGGGSGSSPTTTPSPSPRPIATATPTPSPSSGFRDSFDSVYFVDDQTGWVAGTLSGKGVILATTDGGRTWTQQHSGDEGIIQELDFVSARIGWAAASLEGNKSSFTLLRTSDGGTTWQPVYEAAEPLASINFFDGNIGRAISGYEYHSQLVETTDGGRNWTPLPPLPKVTSLCFSDADNGWAAADGKVMHTVDGARTWQTSLVTPPNEGDTVPLFGVSTVNCGRQNVAWARADGPAASSSRPYVLFRTTDDGVHWDPSMASAYPLPVPQRGAEPGPLAVVDANTASFVTQCPACQENKNVQIQSTADAGKTWGASIEVPTLVSAAAVFFVDAHDGWVIGEDYGGTGPPATILATTDGGQTWTQQYP